MQRLLILTLLITCVYACQKTSESDAGDEELTVVLCPPIVEPAALTPVFSVATPSCPLEISKERVIACTREHLREEEQLRQFAAYNSNQITEAQIAEGLLLGRQFHSVAACASDVAWLLKAEDPSFRARVRACYTDPKLAPVFEQEFRAKRHLLRIQQVASLRFSLPHAFCRHDNVSNADICITLESAQISQLSSNISAYEQLLKMQ